MLVCRQAYGVTYVGDVILLYIRFLLVGRKALQPSLAVAAAAIAHSPLAAAAAAVSGDGRVVLSLHHAAMRAVNREQQTVTLRCPLGH